jgi:hypothetical protein
MSTDQKLEEAKYFLRQLNACTSGQPELQYLVSAFLTSSRSILQYALEEAKLHQGGQAWFDMQARTPEVKFLKDLRDANIHAAPVRPIKTLTFQDSISVNGSLVSITLTDADGTVHHGVAKSSNVESPVSEARISSSDGAQLTYRFDGWSGPEDVSQLCSRFLEIVESILLSGRDEGFLRRAA